ncbi:hypothetical protein Glove_87g119 [Diversispora epigaea]|uniref:DDE-1 domain-containing protein n=1 Tax=Diversispora epigaea TaxID=1348612 RepID=A0A397J9M3_9GLOM|nr:hypothetical protein Glove_87g119 [Diversispora epigaea]
MAKAEHNKTSNQIKEKMNKCGAKNHWEKQLQWVKKHQNFNSNLVIFTDKSNLQLFP